MRDCPEPPGAEDLREAPLHVVIRDFPEALAVVRRCGVDAAAAGGRPVREAVSDPEPLLDALLAATAWRRDGGA